jgi:hypothetical protein
MKAKTSTIKATSLLLTVVFILFAMVPMEAKPKKKKKDKYDYITVTVFQQFTKDMAFMKMKRVRQVDGQEEGRQTMISISFEGDEYSKELEQRFYEQYAQNPTLPLALDFLGDSGWEVSTTNQILVDGGLLMTTVVLQKAKK